MICNPAQSSSELGDRFSKNENFLMKNSKCWTESWNVLQFLFDTFHKFDCFPNAQFEVESSILHKETQEN